MKKPERKIIDPSSIPRADPNQLMAYLESKVGGEGVVIQRAEEFTGRMDLRRPSGIPSLDVACHGGLPAGGLSQIDGPDGIGKNVLMYTYMARCQRHYGAKSTIMMVAFEPNFDKMFLRSIGVRVALTIEEIDQLQKKLKGQGKPKLTTKEIDHLLTDQIGHFHLTRGGSAEKVLQVVAESVDSNAYQIIGIDSWDAMLPESADEKELVDHARVADSSNIQTRWMAKVFGALAPTKICPECFARPLGFKTAGDSKYAYTCPETKRCGWRGKDPYMWENETTIIGIRQVRANMNKVSMHARDYKVGGAHALRHGKLIDIQLRPSDPIMKGSEKIGKEVVWEITKGKAGTHEGIKGSYQYFYDPPTIDVSADMINVAMSMDLITGGGKAGYVFGDAKLGKRDEIASTLVSDGKVRSALRKAIMDRAGLGHIRYK